LEGWVDVGQCLACDVNGAGKEVEHSTRAFLPSSPITVARMQGVENRSEDCIWELTKNVKQDRIEEFDVPRLFLFKEFGNGVVRCEKLT